MTIAIEAMTLADLPAVHRIERASFTSPWPDDAYRSELQTNRLATYIVARLDGQIVAFGGIWLMVDEAHITTFAVDPRWRRRGIGSRLLLALLDVAHARHAREATLEVRLSNMAARRLYEKHGFRPVGLRPNYYSDDGEDALIMTTDALGSAAMRDRLVAIRDDLDRRDADRRQGTAGGNTEGEAADAQRLEPPGPVPSGDGRARREAQG
jgi:ribosomal-protein-alanine N-acetyltransferase